jgi:hypothetical protein
MIGNTEDTITAQGVFIDYEFNTRNIKEIPRRITDKEGRKFNSDMILTTGKAALSIAYREAVLKGGVPMALWNPAYEQAKLTAVGSAVSHAARIDAAMEYLTKLGVSEWQIMNAVGVTSPKELEIDHLVTLKALCEEIKKGVRTIEDVFGSPFDKEIESLFTQLGKNETEKRLLKNSYMGRAKELLEYLRGRLAPTGQTVAKVETKATEKPAEQATQQASQTEASTEQAKADTPQETEEKRKRGRPKKIDSAPEEKPESFGPKGQENLSEEDLHPKRDEKTEPTQTGKAETGKFQF